MTRSLHLPHAPLGFQRGHGEDFKAKYVLGRQLGSGSYAVVYECTRKRDAARFAVKVIQKKKLTEDDMNALVEEVKILRKVRARAIFRPVGQRRALQVAPVGSSSPPLTGPAAGRSSSTTTLFASRISWTTGANTTS